MKDLFLLKIAFIFDLARELYAIRNAIVSNILNLISTLLLQVVLTSIFGISADLGRFYLFLTISMIVVSVITPAFQNTQLKVLLLNDTINLQVLRKFSKVALFAFLFQFVLSVVI